MSRLPPRLRHTFKYPSDTSSPSSPTYDNSRSPSPSPRDELDETEQESLLTHLSTTATRHDSTYRTIFTLIPLLAILPFLYHAIVTITTITNSNADSRSGSASAPTATATLLPSLLAATSLGITSYSMYSVHANTSLLTGTPNDPLTKATPHTQAARNDRRPSTIFPPFPRRHRHSSTSTTTTTTTNTALHRYLPLLNFSIAALLFLLSISFLFSRRRDTSMTEYFWILLLLPAGMLGVITVVKGSMVEIDRGLGELRGLRYEYKGA